MNPPRWVWPFGLAVLLTAMNLPKPLVIDDTAYYLFARQIADDPLDPYGFDLIWYQQSQPAFTILAPPVVPYWLAMGLTLFGENPVAWKLSLFPFAWLLTASLWSLLKRFAPGYEVPILAMTVASPVLMPSFNLMLDVPALALMMAGVALFVGIGPPPPSLQSAAGRGVGLLAAGVALGLAMQTKYTGLLGPGVVLLFGLTHRRLVSALVVSMIAASLFAGWEWFLHETYGESHFLYHLSAHQSDSIWESLWDRLQMTGALFGYLGGLGHAIALLGLTALGVPGRWLLRVGLFFLAGLILIAVLPGVAASVIVGVQSVIVAGTILTIGGILIAKSDRDARFLVAWLILEILGYFALTPFGAARRLITLLTVAPLLCGHLLSRNPALERRRVVNLVVTAGVAYGIAFAAVDLIDAYPEKSAAVESAEWIRSQPGGDAPIWFAGHWGFRYYAERLGMTPILPEESVIPAGSWVVLPDSERVYRPFGQKVTVTDALEKVHQLEWHLPLPVRTNSEFYGGHLPMVRHTGPRAAITIYRTRREWHPQSPPD